MAVSYIQWSEGQQLSVGRPLINDAAGANAFSAAILGAGRPGTIGNNTGVGDAIAFGATSMINEGLYDGVRKVLDVSGDGARNTGQTALSGVGVASGLGIDKINGLPILGEAGLLAYYQNDVQFGTGSFTLPVNSFDDFAPAVEAKILAEIRNTTPVGVPEGGPGLVLSAILFSGLAGLRMKLRAKDKAA